MSDQEIYAEQLARVHLMASSESGPLMPGDQRCIAAVLARLSELEPKPLGSLPAPERGG